MLVKWYWGGGEFVGLKMVWVLNIDWKGYILKMIMCVFFEVNFVVCVFYSEFILLFFYNWEW